MDTRDEIDIHLAREEAAQARAARIHDLADQLVRDRVHTREEVARELGDGLLLEVVSELMHDDPRFDAEAAGFYLCRNDLELGRTVREWIDYYLDRVVRDRAEADAERMIEIEDEEAEKWKRF